MLNGALSYSYPCPVLFSMTSTATAKACRWLNVGIRFVQQMAPKTMRLGLMSLTRQARPITSTQILATRNQFQMFGPDAIAPSAKMVPIKALRGWASKKMMGKDISPIQGEASVAIDNVSSEPHGAAVGATRINLAPEALFGCFETLVVYGWHRIFLSVSMRPGADTSRPLSIVQQVAA